jgi:hypothetical protein
LTQAVRFQRLELIKGGSQRRRVQLGLESKVIGGRLDPQQFELDKGKERTKEMVRLCHRRSSRRFGEGKITFERLVIFLNGIVTSDKFCMSRGVTLQLSWRRGPAPRTSS